MKILLSAYACEPGRGSEPGIGWNIAWQIAHYHEVWVLTRPVEGRPAIEAELARNPVPNLNFIYFTLPFWAGDWKLSGQRFIQLHYYLWQIQAYFVARKLHRQIGFDLISHITFGKYWGPSFLSLLPVPFIWGPVGGGESAPKAFWNDFSFRGQLYETLRDLARWLGEYDPFVSLTFKRSALILATTDDTAKKLNRLGENDIRIFSNVGLSKAEITHLAQCRIPKTNPVRFISIGRLLHWKGFHLALRAFALANLEEAEYWLIGDGPERKRLELLTSELNVTGKVCFWGDLPRHDLFSKLEECHVLLHPSLHESGGFVCSEVMAAGRPVICLDMGGPSLQVTEETGIKIPAHDPDQTVRSLAEAMTRLARNPELRQKMGQAGQKRVKEEYDWDVKGERLVKLYEALITNQSLPTNSD
ncbi:glycosyltransferase family 4 protein [Coleofasciculus chthonoplastes]|uniref:glycosyltransferase family 4 protein n=1 Tax=Coleofasciculus chthonoplastes TaxID=64178 RepID=UPI0032FBB3AF